MNEIDAIDGTHECHRQGLQLSSGDKVQFNDRSRPLTVTGSHSRKKGSKAVYRKTASEYRVVELSGNGTQYHLLCLNGSTHGPMLYKESDWDEHKTGPAGETPRYSRMGERVESITLVNRDIE